jgi:hypothetical protein
MKPKHRQLKITDLIRKEGRLTANQNPYQKLSDVTVIDYTQKSIILDDPSKEIL